MKSPGLRESPMGFCSSGERRKRGSTLSLPLSPIPTSLLAVHLDRSVDQAWEQDSIWAKGFVVKLAL